MAPAKSDLFAAVHDAGRELVFRYEIPVRTELRLELYDVAGRLVKTHTQGMFDPGEYVSHINLSDIPAGMYYGRLWTPERTLLRRFVHVR